MHETTELVRVTKELEEKNREIEENRAKLAASQSQILQQEKMASIGQLAAGVAHEINNPTGFITSNLGTLDKYVNKIMDYISFLSETVDSLKSEEVSQLLKDKRKQLELDYVLDDIKELVEEYLEEAERIRKIVQNLKSFTRIDETEFKSADIHECIESMLSIVWNEIKYKSTVKKEYGELPLTRCHPQQLNQVFMNLFVNAAQAIEKQGEITIRTWNGKGNINISISDTGRSIPEDQINRIFILRRRWEKEPGWD